MTQKLSAYYRKETQSGLFARMNDSESTTPADDELELLNDGEGISFGPPDYDRIRIAWRTTKLYQLLFKYDAEEHLSMIWSDVALNT